MPRAKTGEKQRAERRQEAKTVLVTHEFPPVYAPDSRVLILGSIPSPKSREMQFYYGHPRNRFWKTLAALFDEPLPEGREARCAFALRHHIALWDVLAQCRIHGADDGSIEEPVANDLNLILQTADIRCIFTTGAKAQQLYEKYCMPRLGRQAVRLPSTSPANCAVRDEELCAAYRQILPFLEEESGSSLDAQNVEMKQEDCIQRHGDIDCRHMT